MMRALLLTFLWVAQAAASPYGPWLAEMDRATARGQAALVEQARINPAFARIWARGHLADVVDARVPEAERQVWRSRLQGVGEAIGDAALGDLLGAPQLGAWVEAAAPLAERLQDNARAGSAIALWVAAVEEDPASEIAFYSQMFRAGLTLGRPTEPDRVEAMLGVAKHLAEGRAILLGALDWHADLAAWYGTAGVPLGGDAELTSLLNAWLGGDERGVATHGQRAMQSAERKGDGLRAALISHLGALAAERSGRATEGRTIRVQVLQSVRPVGKAALTGAILAGLVGSNTGGAALPFLHELLDLGPVRDLPWARRALTRADGALRVASDRAKPSEATPLLDAQARLAALRGDPAGQLDALARAAANRWQRGLDDEIPALVAGAEGLPGGAALRPLAVRARFALGDEAAVEEAARLAMSENHHTIGRLRLAQGRLAAAFAHANAGLRRLNAAGRRDEAERHALHDLAAAALAEAGFEAEARARAAFGTQDPGPGHRGCALARAGHRAEALAALKGLGTAGADAWVGRTCRADIELSTGQLQAAEATLNPLRNLVNLDPPLHWRVLALASDLADQQARPVEAAHLGREAVQRWLALGGERLATGARLALPISALPVLHALPDRFAAAAAAEPKEAVAHHRAAVEAVLLLRRVTATPAHLPDVPSAAEVAVRLPLVRFTELRARANEPGLEAADRARLTTRAQRAVDESAKAHARLALEEPARAAWLYPRTGAPLPGGMLLVYHIGRHRGHLWQVVPGEPPRHFDLPGEEALAPLLLAARATLTDPKKPFEIGPLQALLPILLPFDHAAVADRDWGVLAHGPLTDFPFEALVLAPGEPPVFLGSRHTVRRLTGLGPGRQRADRPSGVGLLGAWPGGLPATGALPATVVRAPAATLADQFERLGTLVLTEPVAPGPALGVGPAGAHTVVLTQTPPTLPGIAALQHRGVKSLILLLNPQDADAGFLADLGARLAAGEAGSDALRALQRERMHAADPAVWHPAGWARWLVVEAD